MRYFIATAALFTSFAAPLAAQSVYDANLRGAPQFVQYQVRSPINETISEFTLPIYVVVPVSSMLNFDVGTSFVSARVRPNGTGTEAASDVSGLTDTQVRANLSLGTDFVVLTAGLNLPTGKETATQAEELAAFRIGNDFLAFPISNMGTGFGATAGIAVARPLGSWNLGFGGSLRKSAAYEPFVDNTGAQPRFQPGNEYRGRIGLDHPLGTGRVAFGFTYSKFGNDNIDESIYNTGDRYITQAGFNDSFGPANLLVNAWDLYRRSGTIFTGERTGRENIVNVLVGLGFRAMSGVLEPSVELRNWTQENLSTSMLGTLGLRYSVDAGGFAITPSAGYSFGRFAALDGTADLGGFRAAVAIRVGQ
ncbi:MAG TPA: hypothetical protein VGH98_26010 [Gemmatimonadaceae bacterium]